MEKHPAETGFNRQQISYKMFSNKNCTTHTLECLRLCITIQLSHHACSWIPKYSSRLSLTTGVNPIRKVQLKLCDDILTSPIDVNLQLSDVVDKEQLFFLTDGEEESKQDVFARKTLSDWRAIDETGKGLSIKVTEAIKLPLILAVFTVGAIKENARRIRIEQDADLLLNAPKLR